ncbi:MAG TPA: hypothetical protein VHL57_10835, partial [Flavobacteriales bacterium]|nr:hypothetical protein [Flavobacteriales bacterium]
LRSFTQLGGLAQNLLLGNASTLRIDPNCIFNGNLTTTSAALYISGSTFNGTSKFTKTGTTGDVSNGGNTFNGPAEFIISGTGNLSLHNTGVDQFNGDVLVNSTNVGSIYFGQTTGSATLASGRTIAVGALGFNPGNLVLHNFTQLGPAAQNLLLGASALLRIDPNCVFNGDLTTTSAALLINGSTFNGACKFTKSGPSTDNSAGANTFNGSTELVLTGSGTLNLDYNTGTDQFNGNLVVNSTGTGAINFGGVSGAAVLAAGRTLSIGSLGFSAGGLGLRNFRQIGPTVQSLSMTGTASLNFLTGTVIDGPITTTSPNLSLNGSTFNGASRFTKTGPSNNACTGGNVFNADMELYLTNGPFTLASNYVDDFNGNATFVRTGSGTVVVCNAFNTTFSKNVSTVGSTGTVQFGAGAGRAIFDGTGVQQFSSDAAFPPQVRNLTINKPSGTLDLLGDVVVTLDLAFTSGVIRPQAATSTSNGLLIVNSGVTFSDAADVNSHVDGFLRKIGNTAFAFPVG